MNLLLYLILSNLNLYWNSHMWLLSTILSNSGLDIRHTNIKKSEDLILIEGYQMSWDLKGRSQLLGRDREKIKGNGLFNQGFVRWIGVCHLIKEGRARALPKERKLCAKKKGWKWGSREILSRNHLVKSLTNASPTDTEIINVCYFKSPHPVITCYTTITNEYRIKHHAVCVLLTSSCD